MWRCNILMSLIGCSILFPVKAQENTEESLLRLFTTPAEREQIEAALFTPPPPPPSREEEEEEELQEQIKPPLEIHYQGLILRTDKRPQLLINGALIESNLYGEGFVVKVEQLQGHKVPVQVKGFEQQVLLAPGQRINTTEQGKRVLESYESLPFQVEPDS